MSRIEPHQSRGHIGRPGNKTRPNHDPAAREIDRILGFLRHLVSFRFQN
jgi:hypothetical protein